MKVTRVAVLWESLAGYVQAALRELVADGISLLVVQRSHEAHAAYERHLGDGCEVIDISGGDRGVDLVARLRAFSPDVTLVTTNKDPRYYAAAAESRRLGAVTLWGSEIPPRELWRDAPGVALARLGRLRHFDAALVAGAASREYAHRVGFPNGRIFEGLLTCDADLFRPIGLARHRTREPENRETPEPRNPGTSEPRNPRTWPPVFLFVGQFIPRKGLDVLLDAYRQYRSDRAAPWELWCAGGGPLKGSLDGQPGVRVFDFLAPRECAELMGQAGALVLPSRVDHWGVVIHEAVCAGLPVIATRTSHASADLVNEGRNGFIVEPDDAATLADRLAACADDTRARTMGGRSLELSYRFDPTVFASLIAEQIPRMIRGRA